MDIVRSGKIRLGLGKILHAQRRDVRNDDSRDSVVRVVGGIVRLKDSQAHRAGHVEAEPAKIHQEIPQKTAETRTGGRLL